MCTVEGRRDLCKDMLEASSVVMGPSERSCGRGERVTTMLGAHRKNVDVPHAPGAGQRQRPWFPRRTLSPAAWRRLRLARQDAGQGTEVRPPFEIFPPPSREGIPETAPSPILRAPARGARPAPRARRGRRQGALGRGGRRGEKAVEFPIRRKPGSCGRYFGNTLP